MLLQIESQKKAQPGQATCIHTEKVDLLTTFRAMILKMTIKSPTLDGIDLYVSISPLLATALSSLTRFRSGRDLVLEESSLLARYLSVANVSDDLWKPDLRVFVHFAT